MFTYYYLFLTSNLAFGQQLPLFSQYLYNKFLINPAVAGSDGYTTVNLTAREQWVGYYGAPRTFSFSMQTRILKKSFMQKQTTVRTECFQTKNGWESRFWRLRIQ